MLRNECLGSSCLRVSIHFLISAKSAGRQMMGELSWERVGGTLPSTVKLIVSVFEVRRKMPYFKGAPAPVSGDFAVC